MLVLTLELRSARTGHQKVLGTVVIDNVSRTGNDSPRGDYRVRVGKRGANARQAAAKPQRTGSVENYPRLSYNVWRLVIRALLSAFPEERK